MEHSYPYHLPPSERPDLDLVAVFWDFENCPVPSGLDPFLVKPNIELALRKSGFEGPVFVKGYGNIQRLSRGHVLESLSETGIDIHHVPNGGKNSSDRALIVDMLLWANEHFPPAHIFLISGDSDFSLPLHKLRMLRYSILLAAPLSGGKPSALVSAANKIWNWSDILRGEGLVVQSSLNGIPGFPEKDSLSYPSILNYAAPLHENTTELSGKHGDNLGFVENGSSAEDAGQGSAPSDMSIPPPVLSRLLNIVRARPGIPLSDLSKELMALNINPKCYGSRSYYHLLLSIQELEIQYAMGSKMRDRLRFYLAGTNTSKPTNAVENSAEDMQLGEQVAAGQLSTHTVPLCETTNGEGPTEVRELGKSGRLKSVKVKHSFNQEAINKQTSGGQLTESHSKVQDVADSTKLEKKLSWSARLLRLFTKS